MKCSKRPQVNVVPLIAPGITRVVTFLSGGWDGGIQEKVGREARVTAICQMLHILLSI